MTVNITDLIQFKTGVLWKGAISITGPTQMLLRNIVYVGMKLYGLASNSNTKPKQHFMNPEELLDSCLVFYSMARNL